MHKDIYPVAESQRVPTRNLPHFQTTSSAATSRCLSVSLVFILTFHKELRESARDIAFNFFGESLSHVRTLSALCQVLSISLQGHEGCHGCAVLLLCQDIGQGCVWIPLESSQSSVRGILGSSYCPIWVKLGQIQRIV